MSDETPPVSAYVGGVSDLERLSRMGAKVRLSFYNRDVRVELVGRRKLDAVPPDRSEVQIEEFSEDSRRQLLWVLNNTGTRWKSLLTVTYPEDWPRDGEICREHRRMLIQAICREFKGTRYLWVQEFQGRGAPHWHILLTVPIRAPFWTLSQSEKSTGPAPVGNWEMHCWVSLAWQGIIGEWGTAAGVQAGCRWEKLKSSRGGAAYMAVYFGKGGQKRVPVDYENPGAWWRHSREVAVPHPTHTAVVSLADYLASVDGKLHSSSGWLYGTLHDGRKRAARWLADTEGGTSAAGNDFTHLMPRGALAVDRWKRKKKGEPEK